MASGHSLVGSFLPPMTLMVEIVSLSFEIFTLPSSANIAAVSFRFLSSIDTLLSDQLKLLMVNSADVQSILPE